MRQKHNRRTHTNTHTHTYTHTQTHTHKQTHTKNAHQHTFFTLLHVVAGNGSTGQSVEGALHSMLLVEFIPPFTLEIHCIQQHSWPYWLWEGVMGP